MDDRKREEPGCLNCGKPHMEECPGRPDPIRAAAEEIGTGISDWQRGFEFLENAANAVQEKYSAGEKMMGEVGRALRALVERERELILDEMDNLSADGSGWREKWYKLYVRIQKGEKDG